MGLLRLASLALAPISVLTFGSALPTLAGGSDVITFDNLPKLPPVNSFTDFASANSGHLTYDGVIFDQFSDGWSVTGDQFIDSYSSSGIVVPVGNTYLTPHSGHYALDNSSGAELKMSTTKMLVGFWGGWVDYGDGSHGADEVLITAYDSNFNPLGAVDATLTGKVPIFVDTSAFAGLSGIAGYDFKPNVAAQFALDDLTFAPPSVPEASTTASFGLLVLGLGGLVIVAKRKKAARSL